MEDKLLNKIDSLLYEIGTTPNIDKTTHDLPKLDIDKLKPKDGDHVTVHYSGKLTNGKEFDNSWKKKKPFSFVVGTGQVIKGWDQIIKKMHIGDKIRVKIPSSLGYGSKGIGNVIPPNSDLIFVIKLLKINNITING